MRIFMAPDGQPKIRTTFIKKLKSQVVGCGLTGGKKKSLLYLFITNLHILGFWIFVHFLLLFSLMAFSPSQRGRELETTSKSLPLALPLSSTPHSHLCWDDLVTTMTFVKHFYVSGSWLTLCWLYHLIPPESHELSNIAHFIDGRTEEEKG